MNAVRKYFAVIIIILVVLLIGAFVFVKFYSGESEDLPQQTETPKNIGNNSKDLPEGYTLDSYTIEKVLEVSCQKDGDCETPVEYLLQSRCPFKSKCLDNKCAVVCPSQKNDQAEKAIIDYLLTQKYFSWKTTEGSRNFCVIENLNPGNNMFPWYVLARCGEFIMQNGELKEVSGTSVPTKIDYPNELSFFDLSKFSYVVPRDGSQNGKDIETIFSADARKILGNIDRRAVNERLEKVALEYFEKNK